MKIIKNTGKALAVVMALVLAILTWTQVVSAEEEIHDEATSETIAPTEGATATPAAEAEEEIPYRGYGAAVQTDCDGIITGGFTLIDNASDVDLGFEILASNGSKGGPLFSASFTAGQLHREFTPEELAAFNVSYDGSSSAQFTYYIEGNLIPVAINSPVMEECEPYVPPIVTDPPEDPFLILVLAERCENTVSSGVILFEPAFTTDAVLSVTVFGSAGNTVVLEGIQIPQGNTGYTFTDEDLAAINATITLYPDFQGLYAAIGNETVELGGDFGFVMGEPCGPEVVPEVTVINGPAGPGFIPEPTPLSPSQSTFIPITSGTPDLTVTLPATA